MQETVNTTPHREEGGAYLTPREQLEQAQAAYDAAKIVYDEWKHEPRKLFLVPKRNN